MTAQKAEHRADAAQPPPQFRRVEAESLGATIPTIAALLGHRLGRVPGGYMSKRFEVLLIDAADPTADHGTKLMRGEAPPSTIVHFRFRGRQPITELAASRGERSEPPH